MMLPDTLPDSFLTKVDTSEENQCWLWMGSKNAQGYGRYRFGGADSKGGKVWYAHLFAFAVLKGMPEEGKALDHLCGERSCVNPSHLEAVTHAENSRRARGPKSVTGPINRIALPDDLPESFLAKVDIRETDDCWLWTGSKLATGYGRYRYGGSDSAGGRVWNAHTFCYRVVTGDHDEDGVIDHLCNVRSCVNPKHLEKVTQQENLRRIYNRQERSSL